MRVEPVTLELESGCARLEPLTPSHNAGLLHAADDPVIWRYLPCPQPRTTADMASYIEHALVARAAGGEMPFVILAGPAGPDPAGRRVIGSTRYLDIQPANRALEIGWTWIATPWQRTGVNTQCKYLLLRHAFEVLGAVRVQLKTDGRNTQSQRAIERIGAVREGVLRQSRIMPDGFIRDSVYFSVIAREWPAVKERLESMIHPASG